ncbi:HEAT repeat domain-containing protein [Desmonostoc muscorum LEGE 12446]|nr:HEAT repeat domain-containing protein [Desmonostoc muscorum]MCF2152331.1 HEAT repeat domain-containing protein [Desmonostoc muscorum LEGE 12446]
MGETRHRNSVRVNEQGKNKLQEAKAAIGKSEGKRLTYLELAGRAAVSEKTVKRFFSGKEDVDWESASVIAKALDLELTDLIDVKPTTPPPETTATFIDWREVCSTMLEPQRRITSNLLMQDESAKKERKQIYVPLALVQRTKTDKRNKEDISPDEGTRLYEPEYETQQRFEHEAFLSQILKRREGKTKGKQIAVIGEPGAGKTTLLQAIAFWVLENNLGLPIWISLADLGRNGNLTDIETYIFDSWLKDAIAPTTLTQEILNEFRNQIQGEQVWLLLDGLDEISGGEAFHQPLEEVSRQLAEWIGRSSRVVLTCRLNVWQADRNALNNFETYRLLDFDYPQQVHQFIDNWFVEDSDKGERLKTELGLNERMRLRDLVQTPLRLALLCSIWQSEEGNLPDTKAGLYHQCMQQFYTWKQNRFGTNIKEQQELNLALGRLALRDINKGSSRFRLRETFISEELRYPDDETSLFYKALQLGWLNHIGIAAESPSKEKVYAFYHPSFEEYFAALAIDDWHYFLNHVPENPEQGTYRIFEPQWKEVILLWLGREDIKKQQKEEFIKALVEFDDGCNGQNQIPDWKGFYEYRAYFLAASGIAEFKESDLTDVIVEQITTWGFSYFNIQIQDWQKFDKQIEKNAKAVLVETNRKKAITALESLISDSQDEYTRWGAAEILVKIAPNNATAITALVKLISDSQNEYTRWGAAEILGVIAPNNATAITALVKLISDSQDEYTRWEAAEILVKIAPNNATAITALVKLISDSQNDYIQMRVAKILELIASNNATAITALESLIHDSKSENTRERAAEILVNISPNNLTAITVLVELIRNSKSENIRERAAEILVKIVPDNSTAIAALLELIRDSKSENTRWQAAEILGEIAPNNSTVITALVELICDSQDEYTRRQVAETLVKIASNNSTVITALESLIRNSQNEYTHWRAAEALVKIAPNNVTGITALVELIRDSNSKYTRERAAEILVKIASNNVTAITALVELIRDSKSVKTRREAANKLQNLLTQSENMATVVTSLKDYLSDEACKVIWHCTQTMTYPAFYKAWHQGDSQC